MRKDPVSQINLRLAPELARKLKALSAISGRSLNSLISLAIDEYVFLRRATVLEGQKIVDAYAKFDATLKPVRTAEEREALQAAQSQELKRAIEAERAAYEQAPTSMGSTQGQGVESVAPVHAEPVQTVEGQEDAACMPWARGRTEAQDATQEESQDVPEVPSAPKTEAQGSDPAPDSEEASQSMPANEREGQDAGQEEPSLMAGNADLSQTAEAAPVDALQALARELKAQGLTNRQIAEKVGKSDRTVLRWLSGK